MENIFNTKKFQEDVVEQMKNIQYLQKTVYEEGYKRGYEDGARGTQGALKGETSPEALKNEPQGLVWGKCAICKGDYTEGVGHEQCYKNQ